MAEYLACCRLHFADALVLTGPTGSPARRLLGISTWSYRLTPRSSRWTRWPFIAAWTSAPPSRRRCPIGAGRHHLIDVFDPVGGRQRRLVAGRGQTPAPSEIESARQGQSSLRRRHAALFRKALLCGLFEGPPADGHSRKPPVDECGQSGVRSVLNCKRLEAIDPAGGRRASTATTCVAWSVPSRFASSRASR